MGKVKVLLVVANYCLVVIGQPAHYYTHAIFPNHVLSGLMPFEKPSLIYTLYKALQPDNRINQVERNDGLDCHGGR